jgi:hypothetical protein
MMAITAKHGVYRWFGDHLATTPSHDTHTRSHSPISPKISLYNMEAGADTGSSECQMLT